MATHKLTAAFVRAVKADGQRQQRDYFDAQVRGFVLRRHINAVLTGDEGAATVLPFKVTA